jgi:sugar lactone lactonase YvrE
LITRRSTLVCLLAIAVFAPWLARAEHTRYWRQTEFSEFEKGTAKGVAIRSDGKLIPARRFDSFSDPNLAYLWALRLDSRGRLFAAGGSDAKVVRIDDSGRATTVFESAELTAQTIAFDGKDNLYVGTSPDGKVYKVTADGQKSVFFDPKTKYIWALALDSEGVLFVATGDKGQVFAVTPDGKGALFYQGEERHARSLAFDPKGNLLIGTEPDGLILRVGIRRTNSAAVPEAGASFVIYETDKAEVTSLVQEASGILYASSVGDKTRIQGLPRVMPTATPGTGQTVIGSQGAVTVAPGQTAVPQQAPPYPFPTTSTGGAEVVKISTDGSPQTLWTSRDELVFAMGLSPAGKLLLGTGDKGTIIELEGNQVYSNVAKATAAQVTSLVAGPRGEIFVATANPGKVFTFGPGYETNGAFESETFDAKIFSRWGRLTWWGENGLGQDKLELYVRSGNTSNPTSNWSPWSGPYKNVAGEAVNCPPARFVQWKAVFLDADSGGPPTISRVSLAYLPKNVSPSIDDIAVQNPGIRVMGFAEQPSGPGTAAPVQLRNPQGPGANPSSTPVSADSPSRPSKMEVPPQGFEEKGRQSVIWSAHDDNDDDLIYTIYYRGEGEHNWRLLKDKLTQRYYSWDTRSMPDGAYYLKIVASDFPSNPSDQALSAERESDRFEVANTPPRIENLRAEPAAPAVRVSFDGISSSGAIARAQYALDAADFQVVFPTGLLSDAPKESYQIQLPALAAGEHTVAVEVTDRFDNTASAKVTFTAPARASR